MKAQEQFDIRIDIVSDVVCPWCIVGFLQLNEALEELKMRAAIRWHPFELNPAMPPEGENLRDHIMAKYGISEAQSSAARARLVSLGEALGFRFAYGDNTRMVNTFKAHQLLDWAEQHYLQHPLKLALFKAYFSDQRDVSDNDVLVEVAASVGLDASEAREMLDSGALAETTRTKEHFWTSRGISGVPAIIFAEKYLTTGAQGVDGYRRMLERCRAEAA